MALCESLGFGEHLCSGLVKISVELDISFSIRIQWAIVVESLVTV
jgi:hypothetical protein